jgi:hypothetical protein
VTDQQWLLHHQSVLFPDTLHSSRHKQQQWHSWEERSIQYNYPRSYPLVFDQRNVRNHNNGYHRLGGINHNASEFGPLGLLDGKHVSMQNSSGITAQQHHADMDTNHPEVPITGEDDPTELFGLGNLDFPENFFANPFAVSFPGDLPCWNDATLQAPPNDALDLEVDFNLFEMPSVSTSSPELILLDAEWPPVGTRQVTLPQQDTAEARELSPRTGTSTPVSIGTSNISRVTKSASTSAYTSQIQFVDMADKKGAQRIRNTMNSRKHRQNKLDRIRELEKKLAEMEAEKEKWRDFALKKIPKGIAYQQK